MKIQKKILTIILSAVMVFTLATSAVSPLVTISMAEPSSVWNFTVENGKTTIMGYNGTGGVVDIPSTLGGYSVTTIGEYAFEGCTGLTGVTIPSSIATIGECAFAGCTGLTGVTIPSSIATIGECAFGGCSGLTSVTIENGVASIGGAAFQNCTSLTGVTIPSSIATIGEGAFEGCSGLTSVTIENGVASIGECAFEGCTGLKNITIPDSVTSIGGSAFEDCTGLKNITIPDSVTSIGNYTFRGCTDLESITVSSGNTKYHSDGNCLIETASKTLIAGCKNSIIPTNGSVVSIGRSAFEGCSGLTSMTIPSSITSIGEGAFAFCYSLTSATIPSSITSIGEFAFEACTSLTSVTLDNGVVSIGNGAFSYCHSLTSIIIPDSVTSIGYWVFDGCTCLTSITIPESVTSIANYAFRNCTSLTSVTMGEGLNNIGDGAFENCNNLKTVINLSCLTITKGSNGYGGVAFYADEVLNHTNIIGAQYRTVGEAGIRFCTVMPLIQKNGALTIDANDVATFENIETYGTLIIPLDLIDDPADLVLTANGKIASTLHPSGIEYLNVVGQKYYHKFDDRIQFTAVLVGIPDAGPGGHNYDRDFVAVSYITYNNGETVYSEPCVKSIEQLVAAASA